MNVLKGECQNDAKSMMNRTMNRTIHILQDAPQEYVKLIRYLKGEATTKDNTTTFRSSFPYAWCNESSNNSRFFDDIFDTPLLLWGPEILFIDASDEERLSGGYEDELFVWENNYVDGNAIYFNERLGCEDPFARCLVDFMHFAIINRIIIHHGYMNIVFELLDELV